MVTAGLLADADVRRYLAARVVSVAGSGITYVALPVLVYRLSGSALLTALVTLAQSAPYVLFGLWAGVLADRLDRRRMMIVSDLVAAVALASVPVAWLFDALTVGHALVVGFVTMTCFLCFDSANFGALPRLVGRERLAQANSLVFGSTSVLDVAVPALTGLALAVVEPAPLLALDAVSFLASALLIRAVRRTLRAEPADTPTRLWTDLVEGLRFLVTHPVVRVLTVVGALLSFAVASLFALLVPFADRILGVPPADWRLGALYAAWGLGAVLGSTAVPALNRLVGPIRTTLYTLVVSALLGFAVASTSTWWMTAIAVAGWAATYLVVAVNGVTIRMQVTPDRLMSRVNTTGRMVAWGLGWSGGALSAGLLAEAYGVRTAAFSCFGVVLLALVFAWASPLRGWREVVHADQESPSGPG